MNACTGDSAAASDLSPRVVLVMMPFGPARMPSIGLSMLAQVLREDGVGVRVEYPIVDFLRQLGERDYDLMGNAFGKLSLGDWLFSRFVDPVGSVDDFIALSAETIGERRCVELRRLVDKALPVAEAVIEAAAERIARLRPRIVGLSSSFQQQMASVALARRLRGLLPEVVIVLGGANCSAPMGEAMFRGYPEFDAVVVGPGEIAFPQLVREIEAGAGEIRIPGVYWRAARTGTGPAADPGVAPEPAMDDLPIPDFDDYFERWPQGEPGLMVPFEGSRGCWWGQKQHCVFCSLNHSIHYRSKSSDRLYREIVALSARHPGRQMFATDDILDMRMMDTLTARLAALPTRPKLYYSLKSNIRKDQLQALARAGVNAIQPGVESFADEVLTLMRKGVTGLRNIQMLKWSREQGMRVSWSILYGFPFDQAEYYARMAEWVPALTHLPAPRGLTDVRIQRYSPLYAQAEHFGVRNLRPRPVYAMIHKVEPELVEQLAYNFDWDPPEDQEAYIAPLRREVLGWMGGAKAPPVLAYADSGDGLLVVDTRAVATRPVHRLTALERAICLACDQVAKRHQIEAALIEAGLAVEPEVLDAALARLVAARLILQHDGFSLFLPCEAGETEMDRPARALMAEAAAGPGQATEASAPEPALADGQGEA